MTAIEYSPWHTPNDADPGAVERAVVSLAVELTYAERWEHDFQRTGIGKTLADDQRQWARRLAYFVVGRLGDREVCDLDRRLEEARTPVIGKTSEQRYADAIRDFIKYG